MQHAAHAVVLAVAPAITHSVKEALAARVRKAQAVPKDAPVAVLLTALAHAQAG